MENKLVVYYCIEVLIDQTINMYINKELNTS